MSQTEQQEKNEKPFVPWYMKPEVVESYESWYEGKYKRADLLEKRVLGIMVDQFDSPKSILEIGCGTCHFTRWFSSSAFQAFGADISPLMLRQAKRLWPDGDLVNSRSSQLPFKSGTFDVACFITCFEYMPDPIGVLREAFRVSRQGIFLGLMNKWSLPTFRRKLQLAFGKNDYYRKAHFYSVFEMKSLTKKAFDAEAALVKWRTTLFPKSLGLERDTGLFTGAFLGVAIKRKAFSAE
jgi:ubiquinone/menaquinone biosynthesis C-methylase UbiE